MAEIELKSEEEKFSLPEWVDYEVTYKKRGAAEKDTLKNDELYNVLKS